MVTNILNPNHLLFESPGDLDIPVLNIDTISSTDLIRDQHIKKLVELFNFWNRAIQGDPQVNNDKIEETLTAFADYFDNIFKNSDDIKKITGTLLRNHEISKFYQSIKNKNDISLINLMKFFVEHGLTLANIYEEKQSGVLDKIKLNLMIFPAYQYEDQRTDIDFVCVDGTHNRIMQAYQALFVKPIYQISIREAVQKIENSLMVFVSEGNHIHVNKTILSMISLHKIDDNMFRAPDHDLSIFEINNLIKKFKKTISESIREELDKVSDQILSAQKFNDIKATIDLFKLNQKLPDLTYDLYSFFNQDFDDYENVERDKFKSKDQITEVLETLLQINSPTIYYREDQTPKDALDFLNSLDVYSNQYPEFLDHRKIKNLLALLMPTQNDPDRVKKIEAGILFLNLLARDFKESDPVFFLMALDKLEERNPAQIDEDGQVTKSFLEVYYDSIPDDLKKQGFDTKGILDYIKAKQIERQRTNFQLFSITYPNYKQFINSGTIDSGDPITFIEFAIDFNNLDALMEFTKNTTDKSRKIFYLELIIHYLCKKNKLNSLLALLDDDGLFTGDIAISSQDVKKILEHAVKVNSIKLVLSAIKRGANVNVTDSQTQKSLLQIAIEEKQIDIALALIANGANVNVTDSQTQKSLLQIAIEAKQNDIALALIANGANVNVTDSQTQKSLLQIVIEEKQIDIALKLIEGNAQFDDKLLEPILKTTWNSQQEDAVNLLKKIFQIKPDLIDLINNSQGTHPLLEACYNGNDLMVEYLLHSDDIPQDKRANPNKTQQKFRSIESAITLASNSYCSDSSTKLKMIESLKRAGADLKFKDKDGYDLCRYAIKIQGSSQFFEEIYNKRSVKEKIKNRLSGRNKKLLEIATEQGNLECVSFLYDKLSPQPQGCLPTSCLTISNKELKELFQLSLKKKHFECAKFFLEKDSNIIDAKNQNGDREIEACLQEFLEIPANSFMTFYRYEKAEAINSQQEIDIVNITYGKKIKFLVENNCEISEKFNQILANFRLQNPNPDLATDDGMAIKTKIEFLEKIENLIRSRSPNPHTTSAYASAQVVRVREQP